MENRVYNMGKGDFNMFVADMHCDSLSLVSGDRGLVSAYNVSGNGALQFFASFVPNKDRTPLQRRRETMHNLDIYISECSRLSLNTVKGVRDLNEISKTGTSALFSIEGGAGLCSVSEELDLLYRMGLRVMGLCWDSNELASSAWDNFDTGLTEEGKNTVLRLSQMGIILDVSHMSDRAIYDSLEVTSYPLLATHSNFREVCNSPRNLTREQAAAITAGGGVIGLNIYPPFLSETDTATGDDILRQVDYALTNFGENSLGFGFDIDGTDGIYPDFVRTDRSIHEQVIELLIKHYPTSVVEKIAGGNVLSFLENNLY